MTIFSLAFYLGHNSYSNQRYFLFTGSMHNPTASDLNHQPANSYYSTFCCSAYLLLQVARMVSLAKGYHFGAESGAYQR